MEKGHRKGKPTGQLPAGGRRAAPGAPSATGLPRSPPPRGGRRAAAARPPASGRGGGPTHPAPARLSGPRRCASPRSAAGRVPRPPGTASPPSGQRHSGAHSGGTRRGAEAAQPQSQQLPAHRRDGCRLVVSRRTHPQPGPGSSWRAGGGSERRPYPSPPCSRPPPSPPHTPTWPHPLTTTPSSIGQSPPHHALP